MKSIIALLFISCNFLSYSQSFTELDINPDGPTHCSDYTDLNGKAYFLVENSFNPNDGLWVTDGTLAGTKLVKILYKGSYEETLHMIPFGNNKLIFLGQADYLANNFGAEPWVSDGTETGTFMLKDILPGYQPSSSGTNAGNFIEYKGAVYFSADDGVNGTELWKTDGTISGTQMVKDIYSGVYGSNVGYHSNFAIFNNQLYFSASTPSSGYELFTTDGTLNGTKQFIELASGNNDALPANLTVFKGRLYFSANDNIKGEEIWSTDGTDTGTHLLKDIYVGGWSQPQNFKVVNNQLFFSAKDQIHGSELWVTDGTESGTHLVKDINNNANDANPSMLTSVNGNLFFLATDSAHGQELWVSDGTDAGTHLVKDIKTGTGFSSIDALIPYHNKVYFNAQATAGDAQFYESNGTDAGTKIIKPSGSTSLNPVNQVNFLGTGIALNSLFLCGYFTSSGTNLWRYQDGLLGIKKIAEVTTELSVYPNPSNGIFNFSYSNNFNKMTIEIYNTVGELVYSKSNSEKQCSIDLTMQANGLYIVKTLSDNNLIDVRKIIKF